MCVVLGALMWAERRTRLALQKQPGAHIVAGQAARLQASRTPLPPSRSLSLYLSGAIIPMGLAVLALAIGVVATRLIVPPQAEHLG